MNSEDDDEQLRGLRAVWLSLPDEEAPVRGMAELLAAARAKAVDMAPVPWWRRAFRPPVLALATIALIVGGVVLLTRSSKDNTAPAQPQLDTLLDRGKTAASRGDCAVVRETIRKISKENQQFYRSRVANERAFDKCMTAAERSAE